MTILRRPTRAGVRDAAAKVAQVLPPSPLFTSEIKGLRVAFKAESLQPIGAFKIRGAWHRLTALDEAARARGVVAFSSGNHAQGVAWAAKRLGIAATIVMPADAPRAKVEGTLALGAEVVSYDRATQSREAIAGRLAEARGATLVPSFDDPWVIEGQGSAGVESAAQMAAAGLGAPRHVVVPCGGGGLAAGIALALPEARGDGGRARGVGRHAPLARGVVDPAGRRFAAADRVRRVADQAGLAADVRRTVAAGMRRAWR